MNQFVPDWTNNMGDAFAPLGGEDDGLMELLWCNGHVVMQSQAPPRKPPPRCSDKEAPAQQEQDNAAWFQYPVEDQLERDLFSELFGETPADACKVEEECGAGTTPLMPPPPWPAALKQQRACAEDAAGVSGCAVDGGCESAPAGAVETAGGGRESSMLTIGSSFCGSNHVQTTTPRAAAPPRTTTADAATSSSMHQSRRCAVARARPPTAHHRNSKRKQQRDATETTNEDVEFESAVVTCEPQAQKMTTAKRRRAAEVHNLSERRRRDRINEKMKALQELIPHCNKTDKASMLDEAIEYLKSLQLQLQVMWMGGGMAAAAPVMFPGGVHHQYMQRMVGPPHVASMPRMPPFMAPPPPAVQSQVDHYARCLAVDSLQQPTAPMHSLQGMGFYQQQNPSPPPQTVVPGGSLPAATVRTSPADSNSHRKHENSSKPDVKDVSSDGPMICICSSY